MPKDLNNIIVFKPRSSEAQDILNEFVTAAKSLPILEIAGIDWDSQTWDLDQVAKRERPPAPPLVKFPELTPEFLNFMKAYVVFDISKTIGKPRQVGRFSKPVFASKYVQEAMTSFGVTSPLDLSPEILDEAMLLVEGKTENTRQQNCAKVGWFVRVLVEHGMYHDPYDWSPPSRISPYITKNRVQDNTSHKMLSDGELDAIIELFHAARTDEQKLVGGILAILCCAPMRIEELLAVPRDVDALLDPGDNLQSGLRWRASKGGKFELKYVPKGMLDVAKKALEMMTEATSDARDAARELLENHPECPASRAGKFPYYPYIDAESNVRIDEALLLRFRHGKVVPVSYSWVKHRIGSYLGEKYNVFRKLGITLPDGTTPNINTHQPRHWHNTQAVKSGMSERDRARWSGRKHMAQNFVYDHEDPAELLEKIREKFGGKSPPKLPKIYAEREFDFALIREAMHSTPSGWCSQSLRQEPCSMFGACLNCRHLVCVKGAEAKLEFIKRDLKRTEDALNLARQKIAGGMTVQNRWIDQYERKIERLKNLISILTNDAVEDGSFVMLSDDETLVHYEPVQDRLRQLDTPKAIEDVKKIDPEAGR